MKLITLNSILFVLVACSFNGFSQDTILPTKTEWGFKGQLSSWTHFNASNDYPLYFGARYIPQLNYELQWLNERKIDFEGSANLVGDLGIHFWDSTQGFADVNPYRLWGRYSGKQFELRVGLQKIDFGTAVMIRALRWFDQVDPRDPLQLTDGVYAVLARYYFLNNANVWLWGLYGNKNTKGMEIIKTKADIPEFGGRLQFPVPLGEAGFSYHHRVADGHNFAPINFKYEHIAENRVGIDAKWDILVGLWFEASLVKKQQNVGALTNQAIFTLGSDYTFGLGSGLGVSVEHMFFASSENAFESDHAINNTALSVMYPIGMFDNVQAIFYYDWQQKQGYNFVNWFRSFDRTTFYLMAYWNPESRALPTGGMQNLYGGKGLQFMFVFNH